MAWGGGEEGAEENESHDDGEVRQTAGHDLGI